MNETEFFDAEDQYQIDCANQLVLSQKKEQRKESDSDDGQFFDAFEMLQAKSFVQNKDPDQTLKRVDDEPIEREELPWLKDPNAKISFFTIIKDSVGTLDLSKLSVPVYFNDPTSLLQKCAQSMEYNDILDEAA